MTIGREWNIAKNGDLIICTYLLHLTEDNIQSEESIGGSLLDAQEVHLLFEQKFQVLEKCCRWKTHDVMEIALDFADEHTPEALVQSLIIGQKSPLA